VEEPFFNFAPTTTAAAAAGQALLLLLLLCVAPAIARELEETGGFAVAPAGACWSCCI